MPSTLPAPAFRPRLSVNTPALDSHRLLRSAQIYLAEGKHALAQLTVLVPMAADRQVLEAAVPSALLWADRTPVHLSFGSSAADSYDFYGYVASHTVLPAAGSAAVAGFATASVCYTLTGSSMLMQSAQHRSFPSASASSIARQIAADNQLASYVTVHPRVFPAKVQAGQSDFAFLQDLARQVGWRCWVDGSMLYFVDPTVDITPAGQSPPSFRRDLRAGVWDTLAEWQPVVGETDPSGAYLTSHAAYTVRHDSGQLAAATITPARVSGPSTIVPAFTRIVQGQLASSHTEAEQIAQASANNSRFWVHASATVDGDTSLRPGRTVTVAGDALRGSDQGVWRISEAVHSITIDPLMDTHNTYTAHLTLGRDQEASLTLRPPLLPAPTPGPMALIGAAWRAALYGGRGMSAEIYEAVVVTAADPLGQGRVRVVIPQISGDAVSTWAAPSTRTYGPAPAAGSTVWVSLDTGDASKPVYHAAGLWSPWTPIPSSWMSAGWTAYTGAYRTGPAGKVEFHGEVRTTTSPVNSGAQAIALPGALQPVQQPASFGICVIPANSANSAAAVARVDSAIKVYGANWTFSGTFYLALASISYSTI